MAWILVVRPPRERPKQPDRSSFLVFAACWCTGIEDESILWISPSQAADTPSTMRSRTPARCQRLKRFMQVVCGPWRSGVSADGAPVRNRPQIPFNTRRSPARGTPPGLVRQHRLDHRPLEIRQIETRHRSLYRSTEGKSESAFGPMGNPACGSMSRSEIAKRFHLNRSGSGRCLPPPVGSKRRSATSRGVSGDSADQPCPSGLTSEGTGGVGDARAAAESDRATILKQRARPRLPQPRLNRSIRKGVRSTVGSTP